MALSIQGMQGLGDNIYQRAVLQAVQEEVWLATAWPQLYADLAHVHPVNPHTNLRTQLRNASAFTGYQRPPSGLRHVRLAYGNQPILQALADCVGVQPAAMDLPDFGPPPFGFSPYVVVRPATIRKEWRADSRNPHPGYIAKAAAAARAAGFTVISVADLQDGQEWLAEEAPPADIRLHSGELSVVELLALTQHAAGIIGGVGWVYPAALAQGTPLLCFFGGFGQYNNPDRLGTAGNITAALPSHQCKCGTGTHPCGDLAKAIPHAEETIGRFIERLPPADLVAGVRDGGTPRPGGPV